MFTKTVVDEKGLYRRMTVTTLSISYVRSYFFYGNEYFAGLFFRTLRVVVHCSTKVVHYTVLLGGQIAMDSRQNELIVKIEMAATIVYLRS